MTTALGKTIKEAKAGKLDPADVHAIEQDKRRLLGTFTAPFGGRSFKKYYRALECIEDNTQVWFQIYGANLNLDADGNLESIVDAGGILEAYYMLCEAEGHSRPNVLVD